MDNMNNMSKSVIEFESDVGVRNLLKEFEGIGLKHINAEDGGDDGSNNNNNNYYNNCDS